MKGLPEREEREKEVERGGFKDPGVKEGTAERDETQDGFRADRLIDPFEDRGRLGLGLLATTDAYDLDFGG